MKLSGKVAIVTGSTHGIGRGIAMKLASEGADVVVNSRHIEGAKKAAEDIEATSGRRVLAFAADVSQSRQVDDMVKAILGKLGRIDILVNNAGGSARERCSVFHESTEDVWDYVIGLNLKGVLICTRAVIGHMIERKSGKIVNIASVAGVIGGTGQADYSASKAGVIGFTKTLAKEVGCYGINVNCVSPGIILETGPRETVSKEVNDAYLKRQILERPGYPQDIANAVLFMVSDEASFITGQNLIVCGGISIS
jgi:NAD(P)-dependent dehydrogenase (short-subunit alcohol dehydrogenase family)